MVSPPDPSLSLPTACMLYFVSAPLLVGVGWAAAAALLGCAEVATRFEARFERGRAGEA